MRLLEGVSFYKDKYKLIKNYKKFCTQNTRKESKNQNLRKLRNF